MGRLHLRRRVGETGGVLHHRLLYRLRNLPGCLPPELHRQRQYPFVEDEGWHVAAERYSDFLRRHKNMKVLFLEAAVRWNTSSIVKFSFWQMTNKWPDATYACLNYGEAYAPEEIAKKSICLGGDIGEILNQL